MKLVLFFPIRPVLYFSVMLKDKERLAYGKSTFIKVVRACRRIVKKEKNNWKICFLKAPQCVLSFQSLKKNLKKNSNSSVSYERGIPLVKRKKHPFTRTYTPSQNGIGNSEQRIQNNKIHPHAWSCYPFEKSKNTENLGTLQERNKENIKIKYQIQSSCLFVIYSSPLRMIFKNFKTSINNNNNNICHNIQVMPNCLNFLFANDVYIRRHGEVIFLQSLKKG